MAAEIAYLLAVVEVDRADRVICQAEGCGHSVFRRIHVVLTGLEFKVLGSRCYQQLYGGGAQGASPHYGTSEGRRLSDVERLMLVENTARFIEELELERLDIERRLASGPAVSPAVMYPVHAPELTAPAFVQPGARDRLRTSGEPVSPADMRYHGRAAMHWNWAGSIQELAVKVENYRAGENHSPEIDLAVRYLFRTIRNDPWLTAGTVERYHGIPQTVVLKAFHQMGLITPMHGYPDVAEI